MLGVLLSHERNFKNGEEAFFPAPHTPKSNNVWSVGVYGKGGMGYYGNMSSSRALQ